MNYIREATLSGDLTKPEALKFVDVRAGEEITDILAMQIHVYADGRYTTVDIQRPVGDKSPGALFWETWKIVVAAEAKPDGGYKLPHQKYFEEHPTPDFDMTAPDLVDALKRNDCPTCKNSCEIVDFNKRVPCPDCTR